MAIAGYNTRITSFVTNGGSATNGTVTYPIIKAPFGGLTVTRAVVTALGSVAASGSNYVTFNLFNSGTAGTATTAVGTVGGTAGVADGPQAFSLTTANANLAADEYISFKLGRIGTITEREYAVVIEWVGGQG